MKASQLAAVREIYQSIHAEIGQVYDTVPVSSDAYANYCACIYRAYLINEAAERNKILFLEAVKQLTAVHNDFVSYQRNQEESC